MSHFDIVNKLFVYFSIIHLPGTLRKVLVAFLSQINRLSLIMMIVKHDWSPLVHRWHWEILFTTNFSFIIPCELIASVLTQSQAIFEDWFDLRYRFTFCFLILGQEFYAFFNNFTVEVGYTLLWSLIYTYGNLTFKAHHQCNVSLVYTSSHPGQHYSACRSLRVH